MSENYLVSGGFCITHHNIINPALQGTCGINDGKECVFEAVPVKQTRTFTKEDVEKALLAISDVHNGNRDEGEFIVKTILKAVGRVEE